MSMALKQALDRNGIKTSELAARLGVDPSTISHKLAGRRGWSAEEAVAVVAFLRERGLRPSYADLFGAEAPPEAASLEAAS